MLFAALVFFCVMILTVTHVLDNSLRRSGIRKGHFLIFNGVFFLASLAPPFSLNRYFSVQADAALMLACFVILLFMRKRTLLAFKELSVIFFTALIFLVEILCSLVMEVDWFLYAAAGGMAFYCRAVHPKTRGCGRLRLFRHVADADLLYSKERNPRFIYLF